MLCFKDRVRRAQLVALLLEKDVAQVAAMLGAMKAGKFFLILDPAFPKYRLAAMLKGSRAKLVVTNRRNASLADEIATPDCELIQWEAIDDSFSRDNPEISIAPKALAFINYTSGSTGEPKALLRSHRMILHNIMLRTNLIHVCELDRISLLSSGTSNAITNSLLALLNGAGLYSLDVKKQGVVRPARWLAEGKITITPMSSPLFRALCETLKGKNNFPDLRVVRLRSEAVYKSDTDLYRQYFSPDCIFVTGLSSNETGPLADYFIDHDTVVTDSAVPVGYVAPGKEVVLLNQDGERIGFDEVGEIAVRSRYLSPGYLRDSRLAKAKFKCDPTESGSRIYLTGDMGLMLPNGCLIYKGRKDFRVKVRGYPGRYQRGRDSASGASKPARCGCYSSIQPVGRNGAGRLLRDSCSTSPHRKRVDEVLGADAARLHDSSRFREIGQHAAQPAEQSRSRGTSFTGGDAP